MFPSCERYDHYTHCTVSPSSFTYVSFMASAGITVTYAQSNGHRVPATVISTSECGQYVSMV